MACTGDPRFKWKFDRYHNMFVGITEQWATAAANYRDDNTPYYSYPFGLTTGEVVTLLTEHWEIFKPMFSWSRYTPRGVEMWYSNMCRLQDTHQESWNTNISYTSKDDNLVKCTFVLIYNQLEFTIIKHAAEQLDNKFRVSVRRVLNGVMPSAIIDVVALYTCY